MTTGAKRVNDETIRRMVAKLVAEYAPRQVVLFGSYAYGAPDAGSDIDLLVIKDTAAPSWQRIAAVRQAISETCDHIPVDVLVMTPDELNRRLRQGDHFIADIMEKGRSLYGEASWRKEDLRMTGAESSYSAEWLNNAERDLRLVRLILDAEADSYGAGFHLQQALEKSLKAFLLHNGWRLERTHNLAMLLDIALDYGADWAGYRSLCARGSAHYHAEYACAERYPDAGLAGPGLAEIEGDWAVAQELAQKISEMIIA